MTTYAETTATLTQRVAHAELILLARGLRELDVAPDPLAPTDQVIGTFQVELEAVLAGELNTRDVRVRLLAPARDEGPKWAIQLDSPLVVLLQRESAPGADTYVPYESSAFPVRDNRVAVPDELADDEARQLIRDGAITVDALAELHSFVRERKSEEARLRSEREADLPGDEDEPVREVPEHERVPARPATPAPTPIEPPGQGDA
jgi:hypothetical protein